MALDEIQILYKCYGILEDAKDGAREVCISNSFIFDLYKSDNL